jgi:hypothetical protein
MTIMGLGNLFVKAAVREVGRNLGKGVSNELYGDWHSTPVRMAKSSFQRSGLDLDLVKPHEYDVTDQPEWNPNWGYFGSFFWTALIACIPIVNFILPLFSIRDFFRTQTSMYAKIPARRQDLRYNVGYRDVGWTWVMLKSKRRLTPKEKVNSKIAGGLEILGILIGFMVINWLYIDDVFDFCYHLGMINALIFDHSATINEFCK